MALTQRPSSFYGQSLPRPRIYEDREQDFKLPSVNDALLEWAEEAHWSMGGLNLKRKRLAGKIEGKMDVLRHEEEKRRNKQASAEKKGAKKAKVEAGPDASPPSKKRTRATRAAAQASSDADDTLRLPAAEVDAHKQQSSTRSPSPSGSGPRKIGRRHGMATPDQACTPLRRSKRCSPAASHGEPTAQAAQAAHDAEEEVSQGQGSIEGGKEHQRPAKLTRLTRTKAAARQAAEIKSPAKSTRLTRRREAARLAAAALHVLGGGELSGDDESSEGGNDRDSSDFCDSSDSE
eukprot:jgi/Mesen1/6094/ME000031S05364